MITMGVLQSWAFLIVLLAVVALGTRLLADFMAWTGGGVVPAEPAAETTLEASATEIHRPAPVAAPADEPFDQYADLVP